MPLKLLSYREIKRKLEVVGFVEVVSQKGSYVKFAYDFCDYLIDYGFILTILSWRVRL